MSIPQDSQVSTAAPYRTVPLSGERAIGLATKVSPEDYKLAVQFRWHLNGASPHAYAARARRVSDGPGSLVIRLHRVILPVPDGMIVDHINGDTLDNRRENLRPATGVQNRQNRRTSRNNTSGYKGVAWCVTTKRWQATILLTERDTERPLVHLGRFDCIEEAARAYDSAAAYYRGGFAVTNFANPEPKSVDQIREAAK